MQKQLVLNDAIFGDLLPYIADDFITDINWNGTNLWLNDLRKGRYLVEEFHLDDHFIEQFSQRLCNLMNVNFNPSKPLLEAETDSLRISIVHESVAPSGRSISIRKTPAVKRLSKEKMKETKYCTDEVNNFLENCVKAKMNCVICGLPGTGKTELLKALTTYIPANQRSITIEDNLEIRYSRINPGKDCVELKVTPGSFDYADAIKCCLRQLPEWILLSEARSVEVKYLLESMSTGTHCLTTLHTDDVNKIPDRIKNMMPGVADAAENDIYSFIDVGIQVRSVVKKGEAITRHIAQVAVLSRVNEVNDIFMIYDEGQNEEIFLPEDIQRKFDMEGIVDPFQPYDIQPLLREGKTIDEIKEERKELCEKNQSLNYLCTEDAEDMKRIQEYEEEMNLKQDESISIDEIVDSSVSEELLDESDEETDVYDDKVNNEKPNSEDAETYEKEEVLDLENETENTESIVKDEVVTSSNEDAEQEITTDTAAKESDEVKSEAIKVEPIKIEPVAISPVEAQIVHHNDTVKHEVIEEVTNNIAEGNTEGSANAETKENNVDDLDKEEKVTINVKEEEYKERHKQAGLFRRLMNGGK